VTKAWRPLSEKSTSVVERMLSSPCYLAGERVHFERARAFFEPVREGVVGLHPRRGSAECVYVLTRIYKVSRAEAATKLLSLLDYAE